MRVMHVIDSLGAGGAEQSLFELLPGLRAAGVESSVVCLIRRTAGVHDAVVEAGYPVLVVGADRIRAVRAIRREIRRRRPDIVHTSVYEADVLGRLAAAGTPAKVLTSLVNTYGSIRLADPSIDRRKLAAARAVEGFTARHLTDRFHAVSATVKASAVTELRIDPAAVTVVERGRNLSRLGEATPARRAAVRGQLGLPENAEVVLHVGRQDPRKGLLTLLEAMIELARERPRLVLLQAGREGAATDVLLQLAGSSGVADRLRFLGHRTDIGSLLAAADVFAFPSVSEGGGGSLLEAMAMSVPAVTTDIAAMLDVTDGGEGVALVPVGDAAALARAVGDYLDDPARAAEQAARAHKLFLDRFTLERSVAGMVQLFRDLAAEGSH
ncbi:glycosyltransferase family 4 protein [Nocardioides mesophilus]|uniref:Glycosyltransferase family 4 protein n=1 Tax=Nocardioides mesophilus TaxID=433659 RepID=A0A7G9R9B3_9ACTN|nr:glycosyltransferase family 4 protein [Nocardioides mesophilus]QNN52188.1 glycosyltransferase family 4 protein [Nocardioides mesophilus]